MELTKMTLFIAQHAITVFMYSVLTRMGEWVTAVPSCHVVQCSEGSFDFKQ